MKQHSKMLACLGLVCALVAVHPAEAQRGGDGKRTFEESIDVVTVEVPVYVVRGGAPVRDLTVDNFELIDGNKKVRISGFDVVDLADMSPSGAPRPDVLADPTPIAGRRHFLLVFDLSFSEPGATLKAREAAVDLVMNDIHPSDLVAVATFTVNRGAELALNFTSDRRQAAAAIRRIGDPQLFEQTGDPLRMLLRDIGADQDFGQADNTGGGGGRINVEEIAIQNLRELARESGKAQRGIDSARISGYLASFGELAKVMNAVEGKKHVVLLSEGFDSSLLVGSYDARTQMQQAEAASRGRTWEVVSEERMGQTSELNFMEKMLEEFRRADALIQAVDVGGLRQDAISGGKSGSDNSLFMLADGTGGELYRNFNDLGDAMSQLLDRTSVTYLLSFQPQDLEAPGTFHKLKVKLKGVPKARVVHRTGYYEPKPYAQLSENERRLDAAGYLMNDEESGDLEAAALVTPVPGHAGGKAYVPVLIEVDGQSLLSVQPDDRMVGLELFAYAFDEDGGAHDFFSQNLGLDLSKVRPTLEQSGLKFFGHLDLDPGRYLVRVLVRDARTGRHAARALSLEVPAFGEVAFVSRPLVPEPLGKWLMVREEEGRRNAEQPYPFMSGEQPYVPSAMPQVVDGGSQMLLMAHGAGGPFTVDGWLLGDDGQPMSGSKVDLVAQAPSGGGFEQLMTQLEAPSVPPGRYTVVVNVKDSSGRQMTTSGEVRIGGR